MGHCRETVVIHLAKVTIQSMGSKESDMTEQLHTHTHTHTHKPPKVTSHTHNPQKVTIKYFTHTHTHTHTTPKK